MKKRKILLGLALASLFTFSLSACGDDAKEPENPVVDGGGDEAVEKFNVTFKNGTTELTELKQTVDKNGKAQKPARAKLPQAAAGKRFDFWSNDGLTAYNFDEPVTSDVELTAKFVNTNDYDTLAASDGKIFASDFYDETVEKVAESSFSSNTVKVTTTDEANKISNDNKYHIAKNELCIDFGDKKITTSGVLTVYFEVSFDETTNKEAFFQVNGSSAAATNTEVFGLRVDAATKFAYRLDGSTDQSSDISVETNKTYKCKVTIDTADAKAAVVLDGQTIVEDIDINITAIRGIKFTAKSGGTSAKNVDNVAATFTTKNADPVVTAKNEVLALIDTYKAGSEYTNASPVLKDFIDEDIDSFKTSLSAVTTLDAANTAKTQWNAFAQASKAAVPVKAYTAASVAATGVADKHIFVVDNITDSADIQSQLDKVNFSGYTIDGFYSDDTLGTSLNVANVTSSTGQIFAKVNEATSVTLTYTPKTPEATDEWLSNGSFKEDYKDGKTTDSNDANFGPSSTGYIANTGEYDCLQISVAKNAAITTSTYLKTPVFADATKSVKVNMTGFTAGSGDAKKYVKITAFDSNDNELESVDVLTPTGKVLGDFTKDGGTKDITITSASNISYLKITCQEAGKSFFIVALSVTYEK